MVLLILNFALVATVCFSVTFLLLRRAAAGKNVQQRLRTIRIANFSKADGGALALEAAKTRSRAAQLIRYLRRAPFGAWIETLLLEADSSMTVLNAAVVSGCCATVAGIAASFLWFSPILVIPAFLLGSAAPYGSLLWQRSQRLAAFDAALPDALDLMTRALRAGHAMSSAIELVGVESPAPLGIEFSNVFQQQKLGVRFRDALLGMGRRIPSKDLHFLLTAILIQRETGGDITEILERTSTVIRDRMRIAAEIRTKTAQGKLTGWILALLPVALLILINLVSPGYSRVLFHDPEGRKLLYAGAGFILVGGLIIRKIVDVQV